MEDRKLPAIADLINADLISLDEQNQLNILLNQEPPKKWLREHPTIKVKTKDENGKDKFVPYKYLPIERVEYLLTKLFFDWHVEIKDVKLIGNSVVTVIRLFYFNPVTNKEEWQDGVGASPLQTDKDAGATEFSKLKSGAVMMAAPASKSYAIKDAAECIGKIFGKDLNRMDEVNYNALSQNTAFTKEQKEEKHKDIFEENKGEKQRN